MYELSLNSFITADKKSFQLYKQIHDYFKNHEDHIKIDLSYGRELTNQSKI